MKNRTNWAAPLRQALRLLPLLSLVFGCAHTTYNRAPDRREVIEAAANALADNYIYEDVGRMLADSLRAAYEAGSLVVNDDTTFAALVRPILSRISKDPHLGFEPAARPQQLSGQAPVDNDRATPRSERDPVALPRPLFPDQGVGGVGFIAPGIAYVELLGFSSDAGALAAVDSALAMLASSAPVALIIDLRQNSGGTPQMIRLISTYLFANPTHLVTSFMRGMSQPMERWTLDSVRGPRMPTVPVYVLTSRRTFSAAESFAFGLKTNGRVTLVGEATGGGGHFGEFVELPHGFVMFVPTGRTYDPRTNLGWQSSGIQPDVPAAAEDALHVALGLIRG